MDFIANQPRKHPERWRREDEFDRENDYGKDWKNPVGPDQ